MREAPLTQDFDYAVANELTGTISTIPENERVQILEDLVKYAKMVAKKATESLRSELRFWRIFVLTFD